MELYYGIVSQDYIKGLYYGIILWDYVKFAGPSAQGVLDPELSAFVRSFSSLLASAKSLGGAQTPRMIDPELVRSWSLVFLRVPRNC